MGSDSNQVPKIPKIDLTGLHPSNPGGERWRAAKAEVAEALFSHGCFEATFPSLSPELRQAMFGSCMQEIFALPLETKHRLKTQQPYQGYIGQIPHLAYESLAFDDALSPAAAEDFTQLMWPEGNNSFRKTVMEFARTLHELVEIVQRMMVESLGVEKHYDSLVSSITYGVRMSEYGIPLNQETKISLDAHKDPNLITVVCQSEIDGLEVENFDGDWVRVDASPNSVTVLVGLSFQAWSNMRVRAPTHRVRVLGKEKRFSALFSSRPSTNAIVKSPEELGDEDHPLLFKPFNYTELVKFLYSAEGMMTKDAFNAYCRISNEEAV
ncbi:probable 2-oxoglutarate-dependent dioxygenase AOP1 [Phalaenopsis equestris]|uniref:probable 2-oxoglutarate-dependent dioxygenase AOP1 n=1 Tax=Phalaenopsis equestris TaxID=78828 RepID=UPI0009E487FD|nr:probable 2-oxoglutarate-dependent dioxygenase AOP1 [Phalaenopsis equestris]